jgi:hypothetical protein
MNPASEIITKSELSRRAGVWPAAVGRACEPGHVLHPALTPDGKRLFAAHSTVVDYISKPRPPRHLRNRNPPRPSATPTPPRDPFAQALELATLPDAGISAEGAAEQVSTLEPSPSMIPDNDRDRQSHVMLYDLQAYSGGQLPEDMNELGDLTLREVADRFGTLMAFRDVVKALSLHADMRNKEGIAAKRRGELISRDIFSNTLVPLVDMAFKRLVNEAPQALTEQIIARVLAGGDDLKVDVEALIRQENSGILTDCRTTMVSELEKFT